MDMFKRHFEKIYEARFFLIHLVQWDLKYKFRRSKIGLMWTILQPLFLTSIIAVVFGFVFKQPMSTYAPYILSGILVWEIIQGAVISNSYSFMQAETYIRQFAHPVAIYPLRAALVSISTFTLAISSLLIWIIFVFPSNVPIAIISLPFSMFLYFCISWSISVISSHLHIRYRDYPYIMALLMQMLWYFSPVFFQESMFTSNKILHMFFIGNPVTQLLLLIREPFLNGKFASLGSYLYVCVIIAVLAVVSWKVNSKCEKQTIFYF
jgi:lipopolysaccharide transport system permease protein